MNNQALQSAIRNIVTAESIGYRSNIAVWAKYLARVVLQHFGSDPDHYYTQEQISEALTRLYDGVKQCESQLERLRGQLNKHLSAFTINLIKDTIVSNEKQIEQYKYNILRYTEAQTGLTVLPHEPALFTSMEPDKLNFSSDDVLALINDARSYMPIPDEREVEAIEMLNQAANLLLDAKATYPNCYAAD